MLDPHPSAPTLEEIVKFLRQSLQYKQIWQQICYRSIVAKAAQERQVVVNPEEIQQEADQFRRQNRLESAASTMAWLTEQQITPEDWETGIHDRLLSQKLREALFGKEIEKFFTENRLNFDRVSLYRIGFADNKLAQEVFYQVEEAEISFYEAARLYDVDEQRRDRCGYEGLLYRWSLSPEIAAAVFAATAGQVIAPIPTEQGYHLLLVDRFVPAKLTNELREELLSKLFQEWLENELNYLLHNQ
jgi:parvulin-like peptidyl-prolyl isomerase